MDDLEEIGDESESREHPPPPAVDVHDSIDNVGEVVSDSKATLNSPHSEIPPRLLMKKRNSLMGEGSGSEMVELKPSLKLIDNAPPKTKGHRKSKSITTFSGDESERVEAEVARVFRDDPEASQTEDDDNRSTSRASTGLDLSVSMRNKFKTERKAKTGKIKSKALLQKRLSRQNTRTDLMASMATEDFRLEQALEKSWQERRLQNLKKTEVETNKPTRANLSDQYDFFTKVYPDPKPARTAVESEIHAEDVPTDGFNLMTEKLMDFTKARSKSYFQQIQQEDTKIFMPSLFPVPMSEKVGGGELRVMEQEGQYTGTRINKNNRQINSLEHRLFKELEKGKNWFAPDGTVIRVAGGLASFSMRPDLMDGEDLITFSKAVRGRRVTANGVYQLDVNVGKLLFTHHPLYSKENVLVSRMLKYFEAYYARRDTNLVQYYNFKLHALRRDYIAAKDVNIDDIDQEHKNVLLSKRSTLLHEIKTMRQMRNSEEAANRRLLQTMLKTWNAIKQLRIEQNYSTTSFQLVVQKIEIDPDQDKMELGRDLKDELQELEDMYHQAQMTQKRQRDIDEAEQEAEPAESFDRDTVWKQLVEAAKLNRRMPGEPIYVPVMESSASISPIESCPKDEKDRRNEISKHKIYMRIYFNELEVCKTGSRPLNADFCINFAQIYSLHVYEWPRTISIKIYENDGSTGWVKVAETGLEVPSVTQVVSLDGQNGTLKEVEFSSPTTVSYAHSGVGSGEMVKFGRTDVDAFIPRTSGVVRCSALWGRDRDNTPLAPPSQPSSQLLQDRIPHVDPKNISAIQELQELMRQSKLDPNDPINSQMLSYLKELEDEAVEGDVTTLNCFRLEPDECALVSEEEFEKDIRFRLLELRSENVPEFRGMKMVPPFAKEIPIDVFKSYEKRIERERENRLITDVDALRDAGNKYISMIRGEVVQRLGASQIRKCVEDVVSEAPLPSFGATLRSLFEAPIDRDLKPMRHIIHRIGAQHLTKGQVKLLVNVQAGINLPVRMHTYMMKKSGEQTTSPDVEPMVEVTMQGKSARTSVVASVNPVWQQMLKIDFEAPNDDYSPATLRTVTDVIYINVFDQLVSELPKDDREGDATVHQQVEKRWLGCMQLPFSTLYLNGRVDGTFRLKTPPVFLDYHQSELDHHKGQTHSYIKLLIAIEPALQTPDVFNKTFKSIESDDLVERCDKWSSFLNNKFPGRRYVPLVLDTNGRRVLVCRYLRPILPPDEIVVLSRERPKLAADNACNIVSKIPFVADAVIFPGMVDIWSTCDEFLNMLCGDEEEHAILLYCWLVGLGIQCSLLIGNGLPEGPRSAYVLATFTASDSEAGYPTYVLYNASDGVSYSIDDTYCPFRTVGCIITPDNVYGNIQENSHPSKISYDTTRLQHWTPLFSKSCANPGLATIQPETLDYTITDAWNVVNLRDKLDREIKAQFYQWRPTGIPNWNLSAQETFKDLLPLLEAGTLTHDDHMQRLKSLTDAYKMSGFPLNMGYESMNRVIQAVRSTNVHINYNQGVEFALAVHVHPYSNNILSVWIYIASLIRINA